MASDVSFSAYYNGTYQYPYPEEIIHFPYVFTNNGGHYDTTESVFTCPIYGTYFFIFNLYTGDIFDDKGTNARIMVGWVEHSVVWCLNRGPDTIWAQCGNSAIVQCDQGDRVYVSALSANSQVVGYNQRSTFSGFLLHADIPPY